MDPKIGTISPRNPDSEVRNFTLLKPKLFKLVCSHWLQVQEDVPHPEHRANYNNTNGGLHRRKFQTALLSGLETVLHISL